MAKFLQSLGALLVLHCLLSVPKGNKADDYRDYDNKDCVCVPSDECENGERIDYGVLHIRPKLGLPNRMGDENPSKCDDPSEVCCRDPDPPRYQHECGKRNKGGIAGKILNPNRDESEFGEWPWQAAVLNMNGNQPEYKCGGTLIDERHVLTVAHCLKKLERDTRKLVVRLGEWDFQNEDEQFPHEDYTVQKIIIHPNYNPRTLYNDIAMLRLSKEVTFKYYMDTVCLPRDEDDFTDEICTVTGWGIEAYGSTSLSGILKSVDVPIVAHNKCQNLMRGTVLGHQFNLHSSFLCAGGEEGKDSCKGDGGGPLVCSRGNTYRLAGLVSWGVKCGIDGLPGVYVNVKKYINWITSQTGKPVEEYWSKNGF